MNQKLVKEFLSKNIFAVVGVSRNPKKYGYKVYKDLKEAGYKVYPINPQAKKILGEKCYPSLRELPELPEVVNFVVQPEVTKKVLQECQKLGIKRVWLQPGSESKEAIKFCQEKNIKVIYGACIMTKRKEI